jgi:hypothetical protein
LIKLAIFGVPGLFAVSQGFLPFVVDFRHFLAFPFDA